MAFGFGDAVEFTQDFALHARIIQGQFLTTGGAHGEQNVVTVDVNHGARREIGGFGAGGFGNEPGGDQRLHDLPDQAGGDAKGLGDLEAVRGRIAGYESVAHTGHQPKRDEFASALVEVFRLFILPINGAVLERIGDLRAEEHDEPGKIQANHEDEQEAEAAVEFAVGYDARDVKSTHRVVDMKKDRAD